jgi:hypothetical protein
MSLICFVASLAEFSVVFLAAALRVQTMAPKRTRQVLPEFDKFGLPNVKTKRATPFHSVKKPSAKNSSGTQSNGPAIGNDADFCAVSFSKTERKTVSQWWRGISQELAKLSGLLGDLKHS